MDPHFPRMSQRVSNGGSESPNSHFTAISAMPPSFQVKNFLSFKGSRKGTFLPYVSRRHGLLLFTQHLFLSLRNHLLSIFDRPDASVIQRWVQSLHSWARAPHHMVYPEEVTCLWKLRDDRLSPIHPKRRVDLFPLLRSPTTPRAVLLEARNS